MVTTKQENILGIFDLVSKRQTYCFQRPLSSTMCRWTVNSTSRQFNSTQHNTYQYSHAGSNAVSNI